MKLQSLSTLAASFPTVEVDIDDLMLMQYRPDGRGSDGTIDCLGIILAVYRRAGIALPDPRTSGTSVWNFSELFQVATEPLQLYDVVSLRREGHHLEVIVRQGISMSARSKVGVYTQPLKRALRLEGATVYRVRSDSLP
jgi:hypothetical protein